MKDDYIEKLAIIRHIGVGMGSGFPKPKLFFEVSSLGGVAGIALGFEEMEKLIKEHRIKDIFELNGTACIIKTDGKSVKFIDLFKKEIKDKK